MMLPKENGAVKSMSKSWMNANRIFLPLCTATEQLKKWIDYVQSSNLLQESTFEKTGALSEEGAQIVGDVKDVLEQVKRIAESKNGDDKLQKFIWATSHLGEVDVDTADPSSLVHRSARRARTLRRASPPCVSSATCSSRTTRSTR